MKGYGAVAGEGDRQCRLRLLLFIAALAVAPGTRGAVVVESLRGGARGEAAGLEVGDVLVAWSAQSAGAGAGDGGSGQLDGPWSYLEMELAWSGVVPVVVSGVRDGAPFELAVPPGTWGVEVRPLLEDEILERYRASLGALPGERSPEWLDGVRAFERRLASAADREIAAWYLHQVRLRLAGSASGELLPMIDDDLDDLLGGDSRLAALSRLAAGEAILASRQPRALDSPQELDLLRRAAERWGDDDELLRARSLAAVGEAHFVRQEIVESTEAYRRAMALLEKRAPRSLALARVRKRLGQLAIKAADPAADGLLAGAAALFELWRPDGLELVECVLYQAGLDRRRGDYEAATEKIREALSRVERLAPGSLEHSHVLSEAGILAWREGKLDEAWSDLEEALAIRRRLEPEGGVNVAISLVNLALVARTRGDLREADELLLGAREIEEREVPGTLGAAETLANLASVARERGALAAAEDYCREVLAITHRLAPDGDLAAFAYGSLGAILRQRGDLAGAEKFLRRGIEIDRRTGAGGAALTYKLTDLALVLAEMDRPVEAEGLLRETLEVRRELAPGSVAEATSWHHLGELALMRSDLDAAESAFARARAIWQQQAPGGLAMANTLAAQGELALRRGQVDAAEALLRRVVEIDSRLAPGSDVLANAYRTLADIALGRGDSAGAIVHLRAAVGELEAQSLRWGGRFEAAARFRASHSDAYEQLIDVLYRSGEAAAAFEVLERSKARTLLALLAERRLAPEAGLPAELERERERAVVLHKRITDELAKLDPRTESARVERLLVRQRDLQDQLESIRRRARAEVPEYAALRYPQPLDLAGARGALDPGTVLLSYLVLEDRTLLFVLTAAGEDGRPPLEVVEIEVARGELARRVSIARGLIERSGRSAVVEPALLAQLSRLYELLVEPAARTLASADRVLIAPDGPLHSLPFSSLVLRRLPSSPGAGREQYLVEYKPLHRVLSATVYDQLRRRGARHRPASLDLVAFGDPDLSRLVLARAERAESRSPVDLLLRGARLDPLPESRNEVRAIAALFGNGGRGLVGGEANEPRVRELAPRARMIHFASHSLLDARAPLNSALVLTPSAGLAAAGGGTNGLLQAWEILDTLRLEADLVTLSACQTALGEDLAGEGLIGLAAAFQFSGARSVVASLWSVADRSTTALMERFYTGLRDGLAKDEALRAAQRSLLAAEERPEWATPFHWAGFELIGDWR